MNELETIMSAAADFIESSLRNSPIAQQDLVLMRAKDQEPALLRSVSKDITDDTSLLIRFQDMPT